VRDVHQLAGLLSEPPKQPGQHFPLPDAPDVEDVT
jgi:hypothetical protein